ncbi:hypothetical protein Tco_0501338, partial [Tanacetum coccineum]
SVRSSLLIRDPLPKVKDAYNVFYREESHKGIPESSGVTESKQNATSFVAKTFNNNRRQFNNNNFTRGSASNVNRGPVEIVRGNTFPLKILKCFASNY